MGVGSLAGEDDGETGTGGREGSREREGAGAMGVNNDRIESSSNELAIGRTDETNGSNGGGGGDARARAGEGREKDAIKSAAELAE